MLLEESANLLLGQRSRVGDERLYPLPDLSIQRLDLSREHRGNGGLRFRDVRPVEPVLQVVLNDRRQRGAYAAGERVRSVLYGRGASVTCARQ